MYNYNSDYSYGYSHNTEADTIAGMSIIFFLFFALVAAIIGYVISSLLYMLIFKKAGIDTKKAWIPFYNKWIFFELGGQEGWKSLLAFIPYVGVIISFVFEIIAVVEISKKLGKSPYFAILFPFGILSFGLSSLVWLKKVSQKELSLATKSWKKRKLLTLKKKKQKNNSFKF